MADVLSQGEIDALLSALSTGSVDADTLKEEEIKKKIKIYDFKRPNKLSKDQIHTLHVIYENYSRSLSTYLSGQLRAPVQMEVLSVEQLTYEEFIRSVPSTTIINVFSLPPLEGNAILEINPNLGFAFLDRMLGGPGNSGEKIRGLTEIEQTITERLSQKMLDYLREPWESIINLEPTVERVETNPQFTQLVSPAEIMIIASLETNMGDIQGLINICIPYIVLEPIVNKLTVHFYYSATAQKTTPSNINTIQSRLENTKVPLKVMVGTTTISVKELLELSVGDVIQLDKNIHGELEIIVGQRPKFLGMPGIYGNKISIQVTGVIEEGEEDE